MKTNKNVKFYVYLLFLLLILYSGFATALKPLEYIDKSVSPSTNFYLHANGLWLKKLGAQQALCRVQEQQQKQKAMINECVTGKSTYTGNIVSVLYNSSVSSNRMLSMKGPSWGEDKGDIIGYIHSSIDNQAIFPLIATLNRYGIGNILGIRITKGAGIDYGWSLDLGPSNENLYFIKINDDSSVAKEIETFNKFHELFRMTITRDTLRKIYGIENAIHQAIRDSSGDGLLYSAEQLKNMMKNNLIWQQYLKYSILSNLYPKTRVFIFNGIQFEGYLNKLNTIFEKYGKEDLEMYFKYLVFVRYKEVLEMQTTSQYINQYTEQMVKETFGDDLGSACFSNYVHDQRPKIDKIFENVKAAYKTAIISEKWRSSLGPSTDDKYDKENAIEKLDSIHITIGFSHIRPDYSLLIGKAKSNEPIYNLMLIDFIRYDHMGKFNPNEDVADIAWENGYGMSYSNKNKMIFANLASITEPNYYASYNDNEALDYGTVGATIGHEIFHAFETKNWYSYRSDLKNLLKKLMHQYRDGKAFNEDKASGDTVFEDMGDNMGLFKSFNALQELRKTRKTGEEKSSPESIQAEDQLFYYGWAHQWRNDKCKATSHAADEARVNGPLRNQPGFYKAFDV